MVRHWQNNQTVNGSPVSSRPQITAIIERWPKLAGGRLDLAQAPMKLLAIVNRIDLASNLSYGRGSGGGRTICVRGDGYHRLYASAFHGYLGVRSSPAHLLGS